MTRPPPTASCPCIDNVHTESGWGGMLEAMKRPGLEGRVHLEWISAKMGDRSSRRLSPSLSSGAGRWTHVRFGTRRNRRENYGIAGGGRWCRRPVLVFQRWMPECLPRLCVCGATTVGINAPYAPRRNEIAGHPRKGGRVLA
uniref:Uncharacterized protein n=1 Tax=Candidatus Methanogaster sp. ANME-2c ERB4 TaxID=2759911 RepID=A0A7G9YR58_9EURY|nr:hypothetical protein EGLMOMJH_00031 [Methanosarcinales archaeon ANME-2c ERB4]